MNPPEKKKPSAERIRRKRPGDPQETAARVLTTATVAGRSGSASRSPPSGSCHRYYYNTRPSSTYFFFFFFFAFVFLSPSVSALFFSLFLVCAAWFFAFSSLRRRGYYNKIRRPRPTASLLRAHIHYKVQRLLL